MMLFATLLLATHLACLHYAARLQRLHINLSPAHRVAPLLHSNGRVASGGGINFLDLSTNHFYPLIKKIKPILWNLTNLAYFIYYDMTLHGLQIH